MAIDDRYLTLISSLPAHVELFSAQRTPISKLALNQRLKQLHENDKKTLAEIEAVLQWDRLPLSLNNQTLVININRLLPKLDHNLQQLVRDKVDLRTVIGALRYRQHNEGQVLTGPWTNSRFKHQIENYWQDPVFRLGRVYPWLAEAAELLQQQEIYKLEKLLLTSAWKLIGSHNDHQPFSFQAIVIYVLKWNIINRWSQYDSEHAVDRFKKMIQDKKPDLSGVLV